VILPMAGWMVSLGRFNLWLSAVAGTLGCLIGSSVAYWVGYVGGRPLLDRYGRYILISSHDLDVADRWFTRHGELAIFISRLLPVIRTFISLPAGIVRQPFVRFQVYTFIGSWPWCFGLAYIGYKLGERWNSDPRLAAILHELDAVILAVIVFGIAWYVWRHLRARRS
jgi:membrane protein DedA with SNARE-associated domain